MIGWLLDTIVIAEIISPGGSARVKTWASAQREASLFISILTIGEYEKGLANLPDDEPRRPALLALRDGLTTRFEDRLLPVSDAVVRRWGMLSGDIKLRTEHPPPVIDTLLAATAIEHDLYLVTRNTRDVRASGAAVFNPWEDDQSSSPLSRRSPRSKQRSFQDRLRTSFIEFRSFKTSQRRNVEAASRF